MGNKDNINFDKTRRIRLQGRRTLSKEVVRLLLLLRMKETDVKEHVGSAHNNFSDFFYHYTAEKQHFHATISQLCLLLHNSFEYLWFLLKLTIYWQRLDTLKELIFAVFMDLGSNRKIKFPQNFSNAKKQRYNNSSNGSNFLSNVKSAKLKFPQKNLKTANRKN